MKRFLSFLVATFCACGFVMAQDTIVLRDANELQAKVTSVGVNEIVYLKWENLEGPSYTIPKKDVFFIKYANGSKDSFVDQQNISSSTKKAPDSISSGAKFQGYVYLGADFNDWLGGPSLDFSFGVRTSKRFYIGGGVGWHNLIGDIEYENIFGDWDYYTFWGPYLTLTSDIKAYIPTKSNFYPRFDLSFGGVIDPAEPACGLYVSLGAGFDYRMLSFGAGYQMQGLYDECISLGYVRVGIRFGNK
jgi:hypothetical protein